jgi:uncharacterized protein with PQ loop repeat
MEMIQILGPAVTVIGFLMGTAPLLQLRRVMSRRRADDLSLTQLSIVVGGCALWLAYGLAAKDMAIITSNAVAVMTNAMTLAVVLALRTGRIGGLDADVAVARAA